MSEGGAISYTRNGQFQLDKQGYRGQRRPAPHRL
jgi:Flagellar hook protein FlgE